MENTHDEKLCLKALENGFIEPKQLRKAMGEYAVRRQQSGSSLDFFLLSNGYLTADQLAAINADEATIVLQPDPVAPPKSRSGTNEFGKYTTLRVLGRGAMGEVVEAIDREIGRHVALKRPFLRPKRQADVPSDEERFLQEARVLTTLPKHPNLVEVIESGRIDGQCYVAMEVVDGRTMADWKQTATLRQEIDALLQIAAGVGHAHRHGILHRDLKPSNVMIRADGRAVITDFGLARLQDPGTGPLLTPKGMMIGSPAYMSPEQARCLRNIDGRTDVYSLGVMLYQTMTGRKPFEGRSSIELLMRMMQDPVRRPSEIMRAGLNPLLYQGLENVCLRALQRNPADRTPSAERFAAELRHALGEPSQSLAG